MILECGARRSPRRDRLDRIRELDLDDDVATAANPTTPVSSDAENELVRQAFVCCVPEQ